MYTDNNLFMSSAQAVTATAASTKSLDMATALRNVGSGEPIELIVQVQTTADAVGAGTVTVSLDDSADNTTFTPVVTGPAVGKATLVAGFELLRIRLPATLRRYIQVTYTVGTGPLTAGAFNAFLNLDRQDNVARPSGFSVL